MEKKDPNWLVRYYTYNTPKIARQTIVNDCPTKEMAIEIVKHKDSYYKDWIECYEVD